MLLKLEQLNLLESQLTFLFFNSSDLEFLLKRSSIRSKFQQLGGNDRGSFSVLFDSVIKILIFPFNLLYQ